MEVRVSSTKVRDPEGSAGVVESTRDEKKYTPTSLYGPKSREGPRVSTELCIYSCGGGWYRRGDPVSGEGVGQSS